MWNVICLHKGHMHAHGQHSLIRSSANCELRVCDSREGAQEARVAARRLAMSGGFAGQRTRPWVGPSEPAVDGRDAAAAASSMQGPLGAGAGASTSASAISFGFAATAVLVSMFLLMAIFEHLIKPGLASSSSSGSRDNGDGDGVPRARRHTDGGSPDDKLGGHSQKVEPVVAAVDLTVLMPGQRYPTFLAQPAPLQPQLQLQPCPREGVWWPPHHREHRNHAFVPP
ncbi:hypothetical protein ACP4OV_021601 [Aristida adscensionis]